MSCRCSERQLTSFSLIMCQSAEDLRSQADWDGAEGDSRSALLSKLSKSISPSVMIPEHRLATLLASVQREQILNCRYHNTTTQPSLYTNHECSIDDFPLQTLTELRTHADEVWFVQFSHDGSMLATGGKDGLVCIYDTTRWRIRHEFREHERQPNAPRDRGVCCVAFSPDDQYLISCSQNNEFVVVNVHDGRCVARADHFDYPVTSAAWLPDSQSFVIGTQGEHIPFTFLHERSNRGRWTYADFKQAHGDHLASTVSDQIPPPHHPPRQTSSRTTKSTAGVIRPGTQRSKTTQTLSALPIVLSTPMVQG